MTAFPYFYVYMCLFLTSEDILYYFKYIHISVSNEFNDQLYILLVYASRTQGT